MNKHKNMLMVNVWFNLGEYNRLLESIDNQDKDSIFNILEEIKKRRDLGNG